MTGRGKLNLGLAVGLLALIVIIHFGQREVAEAPVSVADIDQGQVETVRIEVRDREPVLLQRDGAQWIMVAPLAIPVEARRVEEILDSLAVRSQASYPASMLDVDGLDLGGAPQARVVVDGESWVIGARNPLQGWRYIRHGDTVHLANDVLYFRLLGEPTGFASRGLLPAGSTITRIELPGAAIVSDGLDGWTLEPADDAVSATALQDLVDAWRHAQATQVSVDPTRPAGARVAIHLDGRADPLGFTLIRADGAFALLREDTGITYHMDALDDARMTQLARTP